MNFHRDTVANAADAESGKDYLSFTLGAEEYAIDILTVREIRVYEPPTLIAGAPPFIKGVINLRGLIVPIVDLRIKFGVGQAEYTEFTVVIVLNIAGRVFGIVVDSVSDVLSLPAEALCAPPEFSGTFDTRYIIGLASVEGRMLIVTDIAALMSSAEMALIDHAAEA